MKKLFFSLLAAGLFLSIFIGCDKDKSEPSQPKPAIQASVIEQLSAGDSILITLNWESKNATSCYLDDAPVALEGSKEVYISENTTFVFKAKNDENSYETTKQVFAKGPVFELPTIQFSADPDTLPFGGGVTTISWTTEHADSVKYNDIWYAPNGSVEIAPEITTAYTFAVRGKAGEVNSTYSVRVMTLEETLSDFLCNYGSWTLIEIIEYEYTLEGPWVCFFDYYNTLPCAQDDRKYFTMNPNKLFYAIGDTCPGTAGNAGNGHIFIFNWELEGYFLSTIEKNIMSLDENKLVWTYPSTGTGMTTVIKETYIHIP
jgi:hypothetical protein